MDRNMEPSDLTIRILQDIRTGVLDTNQRLDTFTAEQRRFNDEQRRFNDEQREFNQAALGRFEIIETALRDLSEQMVMLTRAIKVTLERRVGRTP